MLMRVVVSVGDQVVEVMRWKHLKEVKRTWSQNRRSWEFPSCEWNEMLSALSELQLPAGNFLDWVQIQIPSHLGAALH
jgi:hypothetical protein